MARTTSSQSIYRYITSLTDCLSLWKSIIAHFWIPFRIISLFPALKLHSPIQIVRPLNDIHTNCEQDVEELCNQISINDGYGYDQNISSDPNEDMKEGENARRLSEVKSRKTYSISAKIRIAPKTSQESTLYSKDNKRFLNYGPNIDMCLWNAFDAQHVSSQCASALTYLNSSDEPFPYHYENDSDYQKTYMNMSISFSAVTLCVFIMCYILIKEFLSECDDNDRVEDQSNSKHADYQCLDESKGIAYVAVPVRTV